MRNAGISLKPNARARRLVVPHDMQPIAGARARMPEKLIFVAVVDDDHSVRTALNRLLRSAEMVVETYASGLEFFHAIEKRTPDCLVLDLQMPGIGGLDVMRYLNERGFRIPVVVITAQDEPGSRENSFGAGARAYLHKPFDADELIGVINDAIRVDASLC